MISIDASYASFFVTSSVVIYATIAYTVWNNIYVRDVPRMKCFSSTLFMLPPSPSKKNTFAFYANNIIQLDGKFITNARVLLLGSGANGGGQGGNVTYRCMIYSTFHSKLWKMREIMKIFNYKTKRKIYFCFREGYTSINPRF